MMFDSSKTFIDTNILVYSIDGNDLKKQTRAREVLLDVQSGGKGVISTQVLQEFFVSATKKLKIEPLVAKDMIQTFSSLELVMIDLGLIKEAIDCSILNKISFWDSLILVSAEKAQCNTLMTEDLNDGQIIRGVRIQNPLMHESI